MYRVTVDTRQHFTDDAGTEYPADTKPLGALMRYAGGITVRALLTHSDYDVVHSLPDFVQCGFTENEAFSVKMAPTRANGTRRQGATERAHYLPSVAPERGMTPVGWPHPCHVSVWPAPVFRLTFFPIFTEYIDMFRRRSSSERKASYALPHRYADL